MVESVCWSDGDVRPLGRKLVYPWRLRRLLGVLLFGAVLRLVVDRTVTAGAVGRDLHRGTCQRSWRQLLLLSAGTGTVRPTLGLAAVAFGGGGSCSRGTTMGCVWGGGRRREPTAKSARFGDTFAGGSRGAAGGQSATVNPFFVHPPELLARCPPRVKQTKRTAKKRTQTHAPCRTPPRTSPALAETPRRRPRHGGGVG